MKKAAIFLILFCFCIITACAKHPDKIEPAHVSEFQYQAYCCDMLAEEYKRVRIETDSVEAQQRSARTRDSASMGVGMVLFWPALIGLAGNKGEPEKLARLRGELKAIERMALRKQCDMHFVREEVKAEDVEASEKDLKPDIGKI